MTAIPTAQLDRILLGEAATLTLAPVDRDGTAVTCKTSVAVTVKDGAGATVVTAGTGSIAVDGKTLSYAVDPTKLTKYDTYKITWTTYTGTGTPGTVASWETTLDVAGGHLFTIAEFKARGRRLDELTAAQIRVVRMVAEDRLEEECEVAFVPRGGRASVTVSHWRDDYRLLIPHVRLREIYAVTVDDGDSVTTLDATELATLHVGDEQVGAGVVYCEDGDLWDDGDVVTLHYAHGYDRPPAPVTNAALLLAGEYATPDVALPPRATSLSTDLGVFRVSVAGRERPTGLPEVDRVIERYGRARPAVG
jgi:hypothetical protein